MKLQVTSQGFVPSLSSLDWREENGDWVLEIPISVHLNTAVPAAPKLLSAQAEGSSITLSGLAQPGQRLALYLAPEETAEGVSLGTVTAPDDFKDSTVTAYDRYILNVPYGKTTSEDDGAV